MRGTAGSEGWAATDWATAARAAPWGIVESTASAGAPPAEALEAAWLAATWAMAAARGAVVLRAAALAVGLEVAPTAAESLEVEPAGWAVWMAKVKRATEEGMGKAAMGARRARAPEAARSESSTVAMVARLGAWAVPAVTTAAAGRVVVAAGRLAATLEEAAVSMEAEQEVPMAAAGDPRGVEGWAAAVGGLAKARAVAKATVVVAAVAVAGAKVAEATVAVVVVEARVVVTFACTSRPVGSCCQWRRCISWRSKTSETTGIGSSCNSPSQWAEGNLSCTRRNCTS